MAESKSMEIQPVKLLPCPFCGGSDLCIIKMMSEDKPVREYARAIRCRDCHAYGRHAFRCGWTESDEAAAEGWNTRTPNHAAALKAAQDAIAVEKRALPNANAALREDAERMRVMREALEKRDSEWIRSAGKFRKALNDAGLHGHYTLFQEWEWPASLVSTAPVALVKSEPRCCEKAIDSTVCPACRDFNESCNEAMRVSAALVAEAGQKEGE